MYYNLIHTFLSATGVQVEHIAKRAEHTKA